MSTFPDGTDLLSFDACAGSTLTASYEFDPDAAPEVRTLRLTLEQTVEEGFECALTWNIPAVCGPGVYPLSSTVTVKGELYDCPDVKDKWEQSWEGASGTVTLTSLDAGDETGNFTGEPLATQVGGSLQLTTTDDLTVSATFEVESKVTAEDAEESNACSATELF